MAGVPRSKAGPGAWRQLLAPALALVVLASLAHLGGARWVSWRRWLVDLGPAAPAAYLALWACLVPCGLPAAVMGLTAGFVFGTARGCVWAAVGLGLAGMLMLLLGRRWLRPRVERVAGVHPRLRRLLATAAAGGARLHLLARLSPLNYALVSYTLAAGGAPWRPYLVGILGGLPGLLAYVWLGAATATGAAGGTAVRVGVALLGGLALLVLAAVLARLLGGGPGGPRAASRNGGADSTGDGEDRPR